MGEFIVYGVKINDTFSSNTIVEVSCNKQQYNKRLKLNTFETAV